MLKYNKIINLLNDKEKSRNLIPTNDIIAWEKYPKYNWIYNKLELCKFSNIKSAPMPVEPTNYPVIIKPITNLYGMGLNIKKINSKEEFYENWFSNNFWMEFFEGEHLSYDIIILKGSIKFYTCFLGHKDTKKLGKFLCWESVQRNLPKNAKKLINKYFKNYSGCINIETLDNNIIECHLRIGDSYIFSSDDLLNGIVATYRKQKYNWNIILPNIYLFPVWSGKIVVDQKVYNYLNKKITKYLLNNKYVVEFDIDKPDLSSPCDEKRLLKFSCIDYNKGVKIVKHIQKILEEKFSS